MKKDRSKDRGPHKKQIPTENHFPIVNEREKERKERKTNKRIGGKGEKGEEEGEEFF